MHGATTGIRFFRLRAGVQRRHAVILSSRAKGVGVMNSFYKSILITFLILLTTSLHLRTNPSDFGVHILHREMFFIPIVVSSFWFGLWYGLSVATIVCLIYTPLVMTHGGQHNEILITQLFFQIIMFLVVAGLIGWLSDRQRRQQKKLSKGERDTALAKAASVLSFEIQEIVQSLGTIHPNSTALKDPNEEENFQQEIRRLSQLVGILSQYKPKEEQIPLSRNLNQILEGKYKKYKNIAHKQRVKLILNLDGAGCPSMIVSEAIDRIVDSLIENALEVSKRNMKILLSTKRGGSNCILTISDEGPGVAKENLPKLFSPFFTTNPEGSGLSLSAGRKVLREQGGDLVYSPSPQGGASFSMVVPRENTQDNIGEYAKGKGLV